MTSILIFLLYFYLIWQIIQSIVTGQNESDEKTSVNVVSTSKEPHWMETLRAQISGSVQDHGYDGAKPYIQKIVEETENSTNLLLHVIVSENGTSSVQFGPVPRAKKHKNRGRTAKSAPLRDNASWMEEFHTFVRSIVHIFGMERVKQMLEPTIKSIEQKYHVQITDVDRNVLVTYYDMIKSSTIRPIRAER